jgi:hypothetical protein
MSIIDTPVPTTNFCNSRSNVINMPIDYVISQRIQKRVRKSRSRMTSKSHCNQQL